jgi:hypothetical protein
VENFKPQLSTLKPEDPTENGLRILANIIARKHIAQFADRNPDKLQSNNKPGKEK